MADATQLKCALLKCALLKGALLKCALLKGALLKCALLKCSASKLKCAASKLPNLRQLTGLQSCEGSEFEVASVGMAGGTCMGTCISTDSI